MPGDWTLDLDPVTCGRTNKECKHPHFGCHVCKVKWEPEAEQISVIRTPNEAVASIKTREDALSAIKALYGTFETEVGREFLIGLLEQHQHELLDWLPDEIVIELAKLHMREEWRGYPWK